MNRTRRDLLRLGAAGGVLAAVAACGQSTGGGAQDAAQKTGGSGKQFTLKIAARASGVAGDPSTEEYLAAKKVFEAKYPKLTWDVTWSMDEVKFLTGATAGDAWDVQDLCCAQLPIEVRAGALMKLDPFIKKSYKDSDIKDFIQWQYKYFNIDGAQYGQGKYMGTTALYYNKDAFKARGVALPDETWDWDKYREAMVKLTDVPN